MSVIIKILTKAGGRPGDFYEYAPGFVFRDDATCREYDWLYVFDEMPAKAVLDKEVLACPKERTILGTLEPVSVKSYSRSYTRQFGHLLTNRPPEAEKHPHYFLGRGYYPCYSGRSLQEYRTLSLPPKTKLISAVCSAKQMRYTEHHARFELLAYLKSAIPEFEWYGKGVKPLERKYDAMDAYKYHIAIENHIAPNHWSEKISDAILSECLPFYAGDPELGKVLPPESFIPIPIDEPKETEKIIRAAIAEDAYSKRREAVLEAKRLILTKYNYHAQVIALIEACRDQPVSPETVGTVVYSRHELRKHSLVAALEDGWNHLRTGLH